MHWIPSSPLRWLFPAVLLAPGCAPVPSGAFVDLAESLAQPATDELGTFIAMQAEGGAAVQLVVSEGTFAPDGVDRLCIHVEPRGEPNPMAFLSGLADPAQEPFSFVLRVSPTDREAVVTATLFETAADGGNACGEGASLDNDQLAVSVEGNRGIRQIEREVDGPDGGSADAGPRTDGGPVLDAASGVDASDAGTSTTNTDGGNDAG